MSEHFIAIVRQPLAEVIDLFWRARCGKLVSYKHILARHGRPARCPKARRHAGACWGGEFVISKAGGQ